MGTDEHVVLSKGCIIALAVPLPQVVISLAINSCVRTAGYCAAEEAFNRPPGMHTHGIAGI